MAETQGLLSYLSLAPHLIILRFGGIFPLEPDSSKLKKIFQRIYIRLCFSFIALYTVQQIIYVYQVCEDIDKMMGAMFVLLTFVGCICKQFAFLTKSNNIEKLLAIMKGPHFNQGVEEHVPHLSKTIYEAGVLLRVFIPISISTCFLWALSPLISHFKGETVELTISLPFDVNKDPQFYFIVFYVWLVTTMVAYNNSAMNIVIMYLFAQAKTQLAILRIDLENLISKCKEECAEMSSSFTDVLERRFRTIIHHYNEIIKFSAINEGIFNGPILIQFLISGWIICMTAYLTIFMSPVSGEFLSMILYMFCILSELFLFCFYGNEVAYESEKLMQSAYCVDWVEMPVKYRRYLIIFMERIKYPITPKAGNVMPLSLNTFVQIMKTSYTFFAFLKNAKN